MKKDKIVRDTMYWESGKYDADCLLQYLIEICHELDVPTPVILKSHRHNFTEFNTTRFRKNDFVEAVDFDSLVIENATE